MDKVVVDSSVVIKWFVVEPYSAEARRLLSAYQSGALALLAPEFLLAEFGNIVWKQQRFRGMAGSDAQRIIDDFRAIRFVLTPITNILGTAYRLAVTQQCTVYDALYLALSVQQQCRFVTADGRLINTVGATLPGVTWVANW